MEVRDTGFAVAVCGDKHMGSDRCWKPSGSAESCPFDESIPDDIEPSKVPSKYANDIGERENKPSK